MVASSSVVRGHGIGRRISALLVSVRGQVPEITDTRQRETQLRGAERMEVIARLAGGLAHDFNNLLMVISGNSQRLSEAMPEPGPVKSAAAAIHDASARATFLTRQLLAFGRRQVFALGPVAVQQLVDRDTAAAGRDSWRPHRRRNLTAAPDAPPISADARQIEHVILNLAINAREAMPSGGTLTIAVDAIDVDETERKARHGCAPGRYVRLVVSDTGGMDAATKAYAFQPFFTTKQMGDGRGLGLATVYGIVKQSHGFVWVESEAGKGATFTLLFPAMRPGRADIARIPASRRHGNDSGGRGGRGRPACSCLTRSAVAVTGCSKRRRRPGRWRCSRRIRRTSPSAAVRQPHRSRRMAPRSRHGSRRSIAMVQSLMVIEA